MSLQESEITIDTSETRPSDFFTWHQLAAIYVSINAIPIMIEAYQKSQKLPGHIAAGQVQSSLKEEVFHFVSHAAVHLNSALKRIQSEQLSSEQLSFRIILERITIPQLITQEGIELLREHPDFQIYQLEISGIIDSLLDMSPLTTVPTDEELRDLIGKLQSAIDSKRVDSVTINAIPPINGDDPQAYVIVKTEDQESIKFFYK